MKTISYTILLVVLLFFAKTDTFAQQINIGTFVDEIFNGPLDIIAAGDGSDDLYVVTKPGIIYRLFDEGNGMVSETWLSIPGRVRDRGEAGLLSMAFHPEYPENNSFFIHYIHESDGVISTRISKFFVENGEAMSNSEQIIFSFQQPSTNHNGGNIRFGPDGYLYAAFGDGEWAITNDSQDNQNYLGAVIRIDVNHEEGYSVPSDNPFLDDPDSLNEIYAFGFRNPWKFSFDFETGDFWLADVGEQGKESIYIVEKGGNYGWPIIEGSDCLQVSDCDKTGLKLPVYEYPTNMEIGRSVTGGYVYRGTQNPSLYGKYVYGDFMTGRVWALEIDPLSREFISNEQIQDTNLKIPTFGEDSHGEIFFSDWGGEGRIFRLVPDLSIGTLKLKGVENSNAIQLNWSVNSDMGINGFTVNRGVDPDELEPITTLSQDKRDFVDEEVPDGTTFYSISVQDESGVEIEKSNIVSYYRSSISVQPGWSMVSIPFETTGVVLDNSVVYSFQTTYKEQPDIYPIEGYWLRSLLSEENLILGEGPGVQKYTASLNSGWNLIGSPVTDFPINFITDKEGVLDSTPVYGFNGLGYFEADTLRPGQSFWIYARKEGKIDVDLNDVWSSDTPGKQTSKRTNNSKQETYFDELTFSSGDQKRSIFVNNGPVENNTRNHYRLPPVSPKLSLDVRLDDGFKLTDSRKFNLELKSDKFPVLVEFVGSDRANMNKSENQYRIRVSGENTENVIELMNGQKGYINKTYEKISVERLENYSDEIVMETRLLPSYPNPFNPATNISYRIAERGNVNVSVYDATGRRVAELVSTEQQSGQYTIPFNASNLASGIYFIRLQAGSFIDTQKLTLIK